MNKKESQHSVHRGQEKELDSTASLESKWREGLLSVTQSWIHASRNRSAKEPGSRARVFLFQESEYVSQADLLQTELSPWDWQQAVAKPKQPHRFNSEQGPLWLVKVNLNNDSLPPPSHSSHQGLLGPSSFSRGRDLGGVVSTLLTNGKIQSLKINLIDWDEDLALGLLVGLELGTYRYQKVLKGEWPPQVKVELESEVHRGGVPEDLWKKATILAEATNLSRHLVNLPANWLHPHSYADAILNLFAKKDSVKIEIWDEHRLHQEGMGLLSAVGRGAEHSPRLVHLSYRPQHGKESKGPFAFVGKGITFDSGGLDIKPSRGMRLMKKDMGGSATLVGLAWWIVQRQLGVACDFYFPLAENAVSGRSFRPGDVICGRNGKMIEIHNTDAEGRLVLADALDLATGSSSGGELPKAVIDVATLTGAIKVGLGADLAGLFSNDDQLAGELERASQWAGDWCWRMPLFQPYRGQMTSTVADMTNSVDGFGGAITAALFLESFVNGIPWAHLDIYAWKNKPEGALAEVGGSGQMVQGLAQWLERVAAN